MTLPVASVATTERPRPTPISPLHEAEKIGELVLLFGVYLFIAGSQAALHVAAHHLDTSLDRALPFSPIWVHPYVTLWLFLFAPFFYTRTNRYYRRLVAEFAGAMLFAYAIYLLFPTVNVLRPSLPSVPTSFSESIVALVYASDAPYNCFPSMHVTLSHLAARALCDIDKRAGQAGWALAIAITISTVLVKQHYLVDLVAGTLLAWGAHRLSLGRFARRNPPGPDDRRARWVLLVPAGAQIVGLIILYVRYRKAAG